MRNICLRIKRPFQHISKQAMEDGIAVEALKPRWKELTGGKPLVATRGVYSEFTLAVLREIWNDYVVWRRTVMPTLPEEEQLFVTSMNDKKIWALEDGQAFTTLFPDDY